jgi:hypothetical protein
MTLSVTRCRRGARSLSRLAGSKNFATANWGLGPFGVDSRRQGDAGKQTPGLRPCKWTLAMALGWLAVPTRCTDTRLSVANGSVLAGNQKAEAASPPPKALSRDGVENCSPMLLLIDEKGDTVRPGSRICLC